MKRAFEYLLSTLLAIVTDQRPKEHATRSAAGAGPHGATLLLQRVLHWELGLWCLHPESDPAEACRDGCHLGQTRGCVPGEYAQGRRGWPIEGHPADCPGSVSAACPALPTSAGRVRLDSAVVVR